MTGAAKTTVVCDRCDKEAGEVRFSIPLYGFTSKNLRTEERVVTVDGDDLKKVLESHVCSDGYQLEGRRALRRLGR